MPMILRDTSQMLLRDGKVVDHYQRRYIGKTGIVHDSDTTIHDTLVISPTDQGATPRRKGTLVGIEALRLRARQGLKVKMNDELGTKEYSSKRSAFRTRGIVSEAVKETSVSTEVTSKTVVSTERQRLLRTPAVNQTPKSKKVAKETEDANTRFSLGNDQFATSTPVASSSQNHVDEKGYVESFTLSEREISPERTNRGNQDFFESEQSSFTKVVERSTAAESLVYRRPGVNPNHRRKQDNIEDSIFEDLSKSFIYPEIFDLTDIDSTQDQTDISKVTSFSYFDSVTLNHARWSNFHHWRRQWYLNRYDMKSRHDRRWLQKAYTIIVSILISIQTFITTKILFFRSTFNRIWFRDVKVHKRERAGFKKVQNMANMSYDQIKQDEGGITNFCSTFCVPALLIILAFLLLIFLLWPHNISLGGQPVFNLTTLGMKNARYMTFEEHNRKLPAWHVLPYGEAATSGGPAVGNKFPVTFYIQNSHRQGITRRIEVFKALSSIGYNVIIPVFPELNIATGWKRVTKLFNQSSAILWGEMESASNMQELAKELCREGFPPSGVVIEIEDELKKNSNVKELEVWTCNCTAVKLEDGSPFSYAHVKCPLGSNIFDKDIVHCLQALRN